MSKPDWDISKLAEALAPDRNEGAEFREAERTAEAIRQAAVDAYASAKPRPKPQYLKPDQLAAVRDADRLVQRARAMRQQIEAGA